MSLQNEQIELAELELQLNNHKSYFSLKGFYTITKDLISATRTFETDTGGTVFTVNTFENTEQAIFRGLELYITAIRNFDDYYSLNLSLRKSFFHHKQSASLIVNDVFNTLKYTGNVDITSENLVPNSVTRSQDQFSFGRESRIAYFALTYRFK